MFFNRKYTKLMKMKVITLHIIVCAGGQEKVPWTSPTFQHLVHSFTSHNSMTDKV